MSPSVALELVALGVMLGSKQWRNKVAPHAWSAPEIQSIVSELQHGGGGKVKDYHYLQKWLLKALSIEWKSPEKPVPAIIEKLKRNAGKYRVITQLKRLSEMGNFGLDMDLDKFFTCVSRAYEEAIPEIEKLLKEKA